jgi:hypothetical protein
MSTNASMNKHAWVGRRTLAWQGKPPEQTPGKAHAKNGQRGLDVYATGSTPLKQLNMPNSPVEDHGDPLHR